VKFLIVSHVKHKRHNGRYYAYGPYVREMNLWFKYVDEVIVVAPLEEAEPDAIDLPYEQERIDFRPVPAFNLIGLSNKLRTLAKLPGIVKAIDGGMRDADHIHLRCPGNMGLLGCLVQARFPDKPKTAKYAGNWDPDAQGQPASYRLQRRLLASERFSKRMRVLVYGEWKDQSRNVVPFFTATYSESEIDRDEEETLIERRKEAREIGLLFVGALSAGKRPMLAVQTAHRLLRKGHRVRLDLYGEGSERAALERYISAHGLEDAVILHGNRDAETVKAAYKRAHFLLFASRSEGWPKVVAEAMFWGCLPVTSAVSCVPYMVGEGARGTLVDPSVEAMSEAVERYVNDPALCAQSRREAMRWSRQFTLERFEEEVGRLMHG